MTKMVQVFEALRRKGFYLADLLAGGAIIRNYREIKKILSSLGSYGADIIPQENLNKLLSHAVNTTPFYHEFKDYNTLQDFPVIDKNLILQNYERFRSSRFKNERLFKASSSGSTGIPFSIYQNKGKRNRNTADVIYFSEMAGSKVGDKLVYIKLWDHTNRKSPWINFLQNISPHNVMDTSVDDLKEFVSKLEKDNSTKAILGYPSFFEELCNYLDKQEKRPSINNVSSIISMAESLKASERARMTKYFGTPVFERYSNQENGILAQKTKGSEDFYTLNWGSYFFEFLQVDSDVPVKKGEVGRIVVTDLFNYSMPMIRYDTGDMGVFEEIGQGFPVLSKIYGRRMDAIYSTKGKIVSPFIFYLVLDFAEVKQFQFVQTGQKNYVFKLNGSSEMVQEGAIVQFFKTYLGEDAQILFEYVDEIPLLSSGKRKKIVNEYWPNA
ncbi:CoF synthetase [Flagellimonas marina]|uniref:CoF synthetase n=1 Tax=Flagellimonas marina TaxID=1775168 RepID=A0ABV8PMU8_9FLAO